MKILIALSTIGLTAFAATAGAQGGFAGPDNLRQVTAAEASGLPDDTNVRMTGYLVRSLGDEEYEFQDDTGTLRVEIDDDDWHGVEVTPDQRVELTGEIEQEAEGAELEVDSVRIADPANR